MFVLNAGGLLRPGSYGKIPLVRDLARANSLLYRQSVALRTRIMVERFQRAEALAPDAPLPEGARRGVLVALGSQFADGGSLAEFRARFPEVADFQGKSLALVPTVFDKLPEALCRRLVYRGWWLGGAAMARWHPALAPDAKNLAPPRL